MNNEEPAFYSVKSFAKLLSISEPGVRKLIAEGHIKSLKLNTAERAKHRIPKSELYRLSASVYGDTENESI